MERTARRCHIIRPPGTVRFGYNGEQVWQCRVCQVFFGTPRSRVKFVLPSSAQGMRSLLHQNLFAHGPQRLRETSSWFYNCMPLYDLGPDKSSPKHYHFTFSTHFLFPAFGSFPEISWSGRSCIVQAWDPQGVKVPPVEKTTGERGPSSQMMKVGAEASILATPVRTGASKETQNPEDNACE
ncbi:hypothetical protein J6590_096723 [Homalodisca vitripennis]|nr:hypothetical protein J6590_096723 [Homalodisca vitripennis]